MPLLPSGLAPASRLFFIVCLFSLAGASGCSSLDLGEVPFLCNKGNPRCPEGYVCTSNYCHREGECPASVPGCPQQPSPDARTDGSLPTDSGKREAGSSNPPRGKFCNGLQKSSGASFTMTFTIGTVSLKALSNACSSCVTLPAGKSDVSLYSEGEPTAVATGTVTLELGKEYLFYSDLDANDTITVEGGSLKPEYKCDTVNPFE